MQVALTANRAKFARNQKATEMKFSSSRLSFHPGQLSENIGSMYRFSVFSTNRILDLFGFFEEFVRDIPLFFLEPDAGLNQHIAEIFTVDSVVEYCMAKPHQMTI